MKVNPVYKRETTVSSRSLRLSLILVVFNGILASIALLNMYSVISQARVTADIQYSSFLDLYVFVAIVEFVLLMFIMPAITAGSISGERERQTLELMLTTSMKPWEIVWGKLASSFVTMFLLIISSFPVLALVFVFGGVTAYDLAMLLLCFVSVALLTGCLGSCFSSVFKKSTLATAVTYGIIIAVAAGTYAINQFAISLARMNINSYMNDVSNAWEQATSGGLQYLLLFNPVATFYIMISKQAGDGRVEENMSQWFGPAPSGFVTEHWVMISILIQLALAAVLFGIAVWSVNPMRGRKFYKTKI